MYFQVAAKAREMAGVELGEGLLKEMLEQQAGRLLLLLFK